MNVHVIDHYHQGFPHVIASYVLESSIGPVLIETGPHRTLPHLLAGLAALGWQPADIRHVFVTHIHLDHAGAAGWWAQQGAQIYVHQVGAPHLVNPARLIQSATRIYGDQMDTLWGDILPCPSERITPLRDNDAIVVGDLTITAWNTPGHAWHHHTLVVEDTAFIGDLGGVRLPNSDWISVTAPPPEFHLESWRASLARVQAANLNLIYPTHFGPFHDVAEHLSRMDSLLEETAQFIHHQLSAGVARDDLVARYITWNQAQAAANGVPPALFECYQAANPLFMSADGIMRYWQKQAAPTAS